MYMSKVVESGLREVFIDRSRPAHGKRNPSLLWGGHWFCPACAGALVEGVEGVKCEACGLYLDEFIFALIERHSHIR